MKVRLFYDDLDSDSEEHPVDKLVEDRGDVRAVGRQELAELSHAIMHALGPAKELWFDYEKASGDLCSVREKAYFDVGVEHGLAAAHANELAEKRRLVKDLAQRLLREAMASGLAREDAAAAATLATWSLLGGGRVVRERSR